MVRLAGLLLVAPLALSGAACQACPLALLEGVLVADGHGGLGVEAADGTVVTVHWPSGVGVGHDGDDLVLTNPLGLAVAHQGEFVSMGGGSGTGSGSDFDACGPIAVNPSDPSPE